MSIRRVLALLLITAMCTGCVRIRETIQLHKDGSGTAHMTVAFPQLGLRWLPGKPVAAWVRPNLPDGVRLTSFKNSQRKSKIQGQDGKQHELLSEIYDLHLSFDRVTALNNIRIRPDSRNAMAATGGGTPGMRGPDGKAAEANPGPDIGPFQMLTLIEEGDRLRFRRVVQAARNPDDIEADRMSTPGASAKPQAINLGDAAWVVSITCPGEVLEHNAQQVDGRTLTWNFSLKQMQKHQDRDWTIMFTCQREGD